MPGTVDLGRAPFGAFDSVTVNGNTATVFGWATDPDTTAPIKVHLYVGSVGKEYLADKSRPDVGAAYPAYGPNHGFVEQLALPAGTSQICAYAINNGVGTHTVLGCRSVTVPDTVDLGRAPFGAFDSVTVNGNTATVFGWAADPDTTAPIKVHLYVGSVGKEYLADKSRPDVGAAYPAYGPNHGFVEQLALPAGTSQICAYAINNGVGTHTVLGCKNATAVPATPIDPGRAPFGNFEAITPTASGATVSGWALDPDTTAPIAVHIYVDSTGAAFLADKSRPDVGAAYPGLGDAHGFTEFIAMAPGLHRVCVYPINDGAGANGFLGCRDVTVF